MAPKSTSTPDTPDSGEPTTSVSATDASTTEGAKAAGVQAPTATPSSAGGAATAQQDAAQAPTSGDQVTRVQIEQAPPEPDVLYPGSQDATDPNRKHVRADYQPFDWNA
jgi:hypothetical protein